MGDVHVQTAPHEYEASGYAFTFTCCVVCVVRPCATHAGGHQGVHACVCAFVHAGVCWRVFVFVCTCLRVRKCGRVRRCAGVLCVCVHVPASVRHDTA
jgi:hypothetical protein